MAIQKRVIVESFNFYHNQKKGFKSLFFVVFKLLRRYAKGK